MANKKGNLQKDLTKLLGQARVRFKEFGQELGILARKSEKKIVKASKSGKIQLDIMSLAVQKEKLYYEIGKKVASLSGKNANKRPNIPVLEPHWEKIRKLEGAARKKKKELSAFRREKK